MQHRVGRTANIQVTNSVQGGVGLGAPMHAWVQKCAESKLIVIRLEIEFG